MEHHGLIHGGKKAGFAHVTTSQWHDGGKMAGFAHVNLLS